MLVDFIAGWLSGATALLVSHPFETIKVRQQKYNTNIFTTIFRTYKYETYRGFFKGMLLPMFTFGPYNSSFFGVYGGILHSLQSNPKMIKRIDYNDPNWVWKVFLAGTAAGTVQVVVFCPVEVIKTILQANVRKQNDWNYKYLTQYNGWVDCLKKVYAVGGISILYRGIVPLLLRDAIPSGFYMITYEHFLHAPLHDFSYAINCFVAGALAGVVSWSFVIPFDVVKSHLQADDIYEPTYRGTVDCFKQLHERHGIGYFTKGFLMLLTRGCLVNAIVFLSYEKSLEYLQYLIEHFDEK